MKPTLWAALLSVSMTAAAFADIIPTESDAKPKSTNSDIVRAKLETMGVSTTEAMVVAGKLSEQDLDFLAKSDNSNVMVGALLPEEWLGAALWFYVTVPYVEKNLRKYILNESFTGNEWFNWRPFDF